MHIWEQWRRCQSQGETYVLPAPLSLANIQKCWIFIMEATNVQFIRRLWSQAIFKFPCHSWTCWSIWGFSSPHTFWSTWRLPRPTLSGPPEAFPNPTLSEPLLKLPHLPVTSKASSPASGPLLELVFSFLCTGNCSFCPFNWK